MFEHSVKVPRPYKLATNIFKKVATEGGSVKTLLYDNKLRHFRTNVLYALITETIKHSSQIDKIFENSSILVNEPRLDPWLAKVLTAELLFGKKCLPGKSKPELTISSYKEQFEKYLEEHPDEVICEAVARPRYVRINTNLLTTSDAIRAFQDEGWRFVRCTSGSYDDYLAQIRKLGEEDFTQDYHVKTVFVFPPGTKFHDHPLYLENQIILQDKATTMAVHLLAPAQGSVALDMCAAPGMKTTQLAAYMRNEGKIYAVERNEERYKTLCDFVSKSGCKIVETIHKDALEIKKGEFDDVEYILLDPSCSGSGMDFSVHNYVEPARLAKLTSLQEKFLKHAMNSFPKAKRIVYSTCSINPEENERVVTNTVKVSRSKWRVRDVREALNNQWNNFGSSMYGSIGSRCLYARPDTDLTTGFFLAILDRDEKDLERQTLKEAEGQDNGVDVDDENAKKTKKRKASTELQSDENSDNVKIKKKKKKREENIDEDNLIESEESKPEKTSKKKKKEQREYELSNEDVASIAETVPELPSKSKKKKKNKEENESNEEKLQVSEEKRSKKKKKTIIDIDIIEENIDNELHIPKKKKKKKDKDDDQNLSISELDAQSEIEPVKNKKKEKLRS